MISIYSANAARSAGKRDTEGLGLAIVKTLTENMKGSIKARYDGNIFCIILKFSEQKDEKKREGGKT